MYEDSARIRIAGLPTPLPRLFQVADRLPLLLVPSGPPSRKFIGSCDDRRQLENTRGYDFASEVGFSSLGQSDRRSFPFAPPFYLVPVSGSSYFDMTVRFARFRCTGSFFELSQANVEQIYGAFLFLFHHLGCGLLPLSIVSRLCLADWTAE